ncbi:MAG TPA: hypothetical protein VFS67_23730 [Polyangiaceae bacterium]|jgi:hypothetical protein|nr:hypothetical protein [Polyangiaceae bacterium]
MNVAFLDRARALAVPHRGLMQARAAREQASCLELLAPGGMARQGAMAARRARPPATSQIQRVVAGSAAVPDLSGP